MSDKEINSIAAEEQRAKLEKLVAAKKGKGGATQLESRQFTEAWIAYAKAVGVNDETVGILYDGFQFAAGEPLYRYVREAHDEGVYISLLAARPTMANEQGVALKVAINLLAYELSAPTSEDAAKVIAHAIPSLSRNKDGKSFGTLGRSIGKILIKPLARKEIDERVSIPGKDAVLVLSVIREPVKGFAKSGKVRSVDATAATKLLAWFEEQASLNTSDTVDSQVDGVPAISTVVQNDGPSDVATTSSTTQNSEAATAKEARREARRSATERPVRVSRVDPAVFHGAEKSDSPSRARGEERRLEAQEEGGALEVSSEVPEKLDVPAIIAFLEAYQKEHDQLADRIERLENERHALSLRASQAKQDLRRSREEIASLKERLASLSERFGTLQSEADALRDNNDSLRGDLSAAEEMLSAIDQRDERQVDESTRRLASELKVEYRDFLDASDLSMDAELGENMRDQLRNVFDILKANGIEL